VRIEKIDFNDKEFISLINFYLLRSSPIPRIDNLHSFSAKSLAINEYIETLSGLDLSVACIDDDGGYLFFVFLDKLSDGCLDLEFAFPNMPNNPSTDLMRDCFYRLCLYGLNHFGCDKIKGTIRRQKKKNPFKIFLKRYIKAISYKENQGCEHDSVYLNRESILVNCEKLKIQSNRDKLDDQTP